MKDADRSNEDKSVMNLRRISEIIQCSLYRYQRKSVFTFTRKAVNILDVWSGNIFNVIALV
jgi:hypothetical protein